MIHLALGWDKFRLIATARVLGLTVAIAMILNMPHANVGRILNRGLNSTPGRQNIQVELSAPSDESADSLCVFRIYCSPMAPSWLCYIGAVRAAFNTVESLISHGSEVVRSKCLKEDPAATTHACRASNLREHVVVKSPMRMGARILLTGACSANTEHDCALLMPLLRLLHCSWDDQDERGRSMSRVLRKTSEGSYRNWLPMIAF